MDEEAGFDFPDVDSRNKRGKEVRQSIVQGLVVLNSCQREVCDSSWRMLKVMVGCLLFL